MNTLVAYVIDFVDGVLKKFMSQYFCETLLDPFEKDFEK